MGDFLSRTQARRTLSVVGKIDLLSVDFVLLRKVGTIFCVDRFSTHNALPLSG